MSNKINKPTAKLRSIKDTPKKPQPSNNFALTFDLQKTEDGKIGRANLRMIFEGQAELLQNNEPTEIGYQMLLDALADCARLIAEQAGGKTILNTNLLKEAIVERLGLEKKNKVKLIGLN